MTVHRLVIKKSVVKDLRPIPRHDVGRILKHIESLATEPRPIGCEKLSEDDKYRCVKGLTELSTKSKIKIWWWSW